MHWECDGGTEYDMTEGPDKERSVPEITLFLNEDSLEFANEYRAREVIEQVLLLHAGRDFPVQGEQLRQEYETIDESELYDDSG